MSTTIRDPRDRFTERVENYVRFRPGYPAVIVQHLRSLLPASGPLVADVGAGTGIFTRILLEHGCIVHAVEPNRAMRLEAEQSLKLLPGFFAVDGDAVSTTLADNSVDAVTAAQAFHWFASHETVSEFDRILRPEGVVLLTWNDRRTDTDRFHREYEELLVRYCCDYSTVTQTNISDDTVAALFEGWECSTKRVNNRQDLDLSSLKGRLESSSYCPEPADPNYRTVMEKLGQLFAREQSGGVVGMEYVCRAYYLTRRH